MTGLTRQYRGDISPVLQTWEKRSWNKDVIGDYFATDNERIAKFAGLYFQVLSADKFTRFLGEARAVNPWCWSCLLRTVQDKWNRAIEEVSR